MAVFVDMGIFVALHNADDHYHQKSKELIKNALLGNVGRIYTSDYIIDEAITTALVRTKNHDIAEELGTYIIESPRINKLTIDQDTFKKAWTKFKTLQDKKLSFTDFTSIGLQKNTT